MSNDLNQCNFIGRLGKNPEKIISALGLSVVRFSIAVQESYLDKNGEKVKNVEWVTCSAFGKLADICEKYLRKGSRVYISGKFKTHKYTGKDGSEKQSTNINVNELQILTFSEETNDKPVEAAHHSDFDDDSDIPF
jgi:single-strand DNA-binding protein